MFEENVKTAKKHHNNPTSHNKDMLVNTATECSRLIIEAQRKKTYPTECST